MTFITNLKPTESVMNITSAKLVDVIVALYALFGVNITVSSIEAKKLAAYCARGEKIAAIKFMRHNHPEEANLKQHKRVMVTLEGMLKQCDYVMID